MSDSLSELSEDEDFLSSPYKLGKVQLEPGELFEKKFAQHEELGKGRYGVVYRVSERETGHKRAAKLIKCIKKEEREKVREEIEIMNSLRHNKLLQLLAAYERKKDCVMIMEYIGGGELFERVVADDFALTERDCIHFIRQICEGVEYMHSNSIVHLDLKPENILCVRRSSNQIKLIDFGLAKKLDPDKQCRVLFGTPEFVAPEVINYDPISFASDMWSVGVICYVLLSGLSPFMGDSDAETFSNITSAEFDFEDEAFDAISADAKDFITRLLIKRKEKRLTASECLRCGWLAQSERSMKQVVLSTDKLKRFIIRRKWQKTGNAIRALGRMANLTNLRNSSPTRLSTLPEDKTTSQPSSPTSPTQKQLPTSTTKASPLMKYSFKKFPKSSSASVSERSDSGISELSECSSSFEDGPRRRSSTPLNSLLKEQHNSVTNSGSLTTHNGFSNSFTGSFDKDSKADRLNWQTSVDSAVGEEESILSVGGGGGSIKDFSSSRRISKEELLPSKPNSCHRLDTHSRV